MNNAISTREFDKFTFVFLVSLPHKGSKRLSDDINALPVYFPHIKKCILSKLKEFFSETKQRIPAPRN